MDRTSSREEVWISSLKQSFHFIHSKFSHVGQESHDIIHFKFDPNPIT